MKLPGHPNHHDWHVNPYTCGAGIHRTCSGFSGGYDTYSCGCCCHDPERDPAFELTSEDRATIQRMKGQRP